MPNAARAAFDDVVGGETEPNAEFVAAAAAPLNTRCVNSKDVIIGIDMLSLLY